MSHWEIQFYGKRHEYGFISGNRGRIKFVAKEDAEGMIEVLQILDKEATQFIAVEQIES